MSHKKANGSALLEANRLLAQENTALHFEVEVLKQEVGMERERYTRVSERRSKSVLIMCLLDREMQLKITKKAKNAIEASDAQL
jgi:hypothetical protein